MSEGAPLRAATVTSMAAEQHPHAVAQLGVARAAGGQRSREEEEAASAAAAAAALTVAKGAAAARDQQYEPSGDELQQELLKRARAEEEDARRRTPEEQTASPAAERKPKARKKGEARVKEDAASATAATATVAKGAAAAEEGDVFYVQLTGALGANSTGVLSALPDSWTQLKVTNRGQARGGALITLARDGQGNVWMRISLSLRSSRQGQPERFQASIPTVGRIKGHKMWASKQAGPPSSRAAADELAPKLRDDEELRNEAQFADRHSSSTTPGEQLH